MTVPQRAHFEWDGSFNARDLGGLPTLDGRRTLHGVLIRADTVCTLSDDGRQQLVADGIRSVVDLRGAGELEQAPNPFAAGDTVTYVHRPFNDAAVEARIRGMASAPDRYAAMVDANGKRVVAIVDALATAPRAVLFHCLAGRDRTGIVAALVLRLAGVAPGLIEEDYALSDERMEPQYARWRETFDPERRERFDRSIGEAAASIRAALARVDDGWGGVEGYLLAHGLPAERISRLRADLVGDRPRSRPAARAERR